MSSAAVLGGSAIESSPPHARLFPIPNLNLAPTLRRTRQYPGEIRIKIKIKIQNRPDGFDFTAVGMGGS